MFGYRPAASFVLPLGPVDRISGAKLLPYRVWIAREEQIEIGQIEIVHRGRASRAIATSASTLRAPT
jgi:hypothetical protein